MCGVEEKTKMYSKLTNQSPGRNQTNRPLSYSYENGIFQSFPSPRSPSSPTVPSPRTKLVSELRVDPKTGATYTSHFDPNLESLGSRISVDTIDRSRAKQLKNTQLDQLHHDPYEENRYVAYEVTEAEKADFKAVLPLVSQFKIVKDSIIVGQSLDEARKDGPQNTKDSSTHSENGSLRNDQKNFQINITDHQKRLENEDVLASFFLNARTDGIGQTIHTSLSSSKSQHKPNSLAERIHSENLFFDPLKAICEPNTTVHTILKSHNYVRQVIIYFQRLLSIPIDQRPFLTYNTFMRDAMSAGLVLDVPNVDEKIQTNILTSNKPKVAIEDESFVFDENAGVLTLIYRFSEEYSKNDNQNSDEQRTLSINKNDTKDTDTGLGTILRNDDQIVSFKDVTNEELDAIIEDFLFCKFILMIDQKDIKTIRDFVSNQNVYHKDSKTTKDMKEKVSNRDKSLAKIHVKLMTFFFTMRT